MLQLFALTVSFLIAAAVGVRIACRQRNAAVKRVGCRGAEAVAVLFLNITTRSAIFTLVMQRSSDRQPDRRSQSYDRWLRRWYGLAVMQCRWFQPSPPPFNQHIGCPLRTS